jgi:hypothetical protein
MIFRFCGGIVKPKGERSVCVYGDQGGDLVSTGIVEVKVACRVLR